MPAQDVAADKAAAAKALLVLSDLPAGWTSAPHDSSTDASADAQLTSCLGADNALVSGPTIVDSPDFSDGNGDGVSSSIELKPSVDAVNTDIEILSSSKLPACTKTLIEGELAAGIGTGTQLGTVTVEDVTGPPIGDFVRQIRVTAPVTQAGQTTPIVVDVVLVAQGRAEITLIVTGVGAPLPDEFTRGLAHAILGRLPAT